MIKIAAPLFLLPTAVAGRPTSRGVDGFAQLLAGAPAGMTVATVSGKPAPVAAADGNGLPTAPVPAAQVLTGVAALPTICPIADPDPAPVTDGPVPFVRPMANPRPPRLPASLDDAPAPVRSDRRPAAAERRSARHDEGEQRREQAAEAAVDRDGAVLPAGKEAADKAPSIDGSNGDAPTLGGCEVILDPVPLALPIATLPTQPPTTLPTGAPSTGVAVCALPIERPHAGGARAGATTEGQAAPVKVGGIVATAATAIPVPVATAVPEAPGDAIVPAPSPSAEQLPVDAPATDASRSAPISASVVASVIPAGAAATIEADAAATPARTEPPVPVGPVSAAALPAASSPAAAALTDQPEGAEQTETHPPEATSPPIAEQRPTASNAGASVATGSLDASPVPALPVAALPLPAAATSVDGGSTAPGARPDVLVDAAAPTIPATPLAPAGPPNSAAPVVSGADASRALPAPPAAAALVGSDAPPSPVTAATLAATAARGSAATAEPSPRLSSGGELKVGATAPAASIFAAAIGAVDRQERVAPANAPIATMTEAIAPRRQQDVAPAPLGDVLSRLLATSGSAPVATTTMTGNQPSLDLADHRWPTAMVDQIERLRDAADAGSTRIRVVPDALGSIDVTLRRHDGGAVQVRLDADQPATRALLADAAPDLTRLAESRGIRLAEPIAASAGAGSGGSFAGSADGGGWRDQGGQTGQRQPASPPRPVRAAASQFDEEAEAAGGRIA